MNNLSKFETIIFDCDGVILNSNKLKTEGFEYAVKKYGKKACNLIKTYHIKNGGISRIEKFKFFIQNIFPLLDIKYKSKKPHLKELIESYSDYISLKLSSCELNNDLEYVKNRTTNSKWMVVSGGSQDEIRDVFKKRKIDKLFELGIFGNPDPKNIILERELYKLNIKKPSLYIGDSKYDYLCAKNQGIDFLFLSCWTEVRDWPSWCKENKINHCNSLRDLE